MTERPYGIKDIITLLKAMDAHLDKETAMVIIGGTAALLAYKVSRATYDIDTFNNLKYLEKAYLLAKREPGLHIPLSYATVADAPYHYEDRLVQFKKLRLSKLNIYIPEIHDFILMKTIRGYEHDFVLIEEICRKNKVKPKVLIQRFESEMAHVVGNTKRIKLNFQVLMSRCFGIEFL